MYNRCILHITVKLTIEVQTKACEKISNTRDLHSSNLCISCSSVYKINIVCQSIKYYSIYPSIKISNCLVRGTWQLRSLGRIIIRLSELLLVDHTCLE